MFFTVLGILFFLSHPTVLAQTVDLQIPIGETKSIPVCSGELCHGIALYIVEFTKWLVGAITMLAVTAIMFGGLIWLTSRANQNQLAFAKKLIKDSLWGLGLALGSYLLLSIISPDLVNFKDLSTLQIEKVDFEGYTPDPLEVSTTGSGSSSGGGSGSGSSSGGGSGSGSSSGGGSGSGSSGSGGSGGSGSPRGSSGGGCGGVATAADVRRLNHPNLTGKDAHGKLCKKGTADALEKAADICKRKYGQSLPILDAWRSVEEQADLFRTKGPGQACNPHKHRGVVTCPHTWGNAVDIDTAGLTNTQYTHMSECMKEAGFCRLTGGHPCEPWHFELPKRSGSCNPNFEPSYRVPNGIKNDKRQRTNRYCSSPH